MPISVTHASIAYIGIAAPLMLYGFMQQGLVDGRMHLHVLDDVHLIESEILAPPTASTFKNSIIKLASYECSDSE